jgi:rubredoxin/uncharacterized membrane protein
MKKWECTVCGYIHTGEEPPETCPVCGADKSKFVEVTETEEKPEEKKVPQSTPASKADTVKPSPDEVSKSHSSPYSLITDLMIKHHVHPVSVHFPNGVVPVAVLFIFLAVFFQFAGLARASFYNMVVVLLSLPLVLFSGFNEWKQKYKRSLTGIFMVKIIAAFVVTASALIIVLWHLIDPNITTSPATLKTGFLLLHLIMLAAAGIAGFIGGKLVFKD